MAPGGHRKTIRPRSGHRRRAESRNRQSAPGKPGLPHRPLPRQRDGPEYSGVSLRQRHFRAGVESPLRRSRAGHRRRRTRRRTPRRLLRPRRRALRHGSQSHLSADQSDRDGAADFFRRRRRSRRADQNPARHPAHESRTRAGPRRARAIRRGNSRRPARSGLSHRAAGAARIDHRNFRRAGSEYRQLALGRRAVLPAHRKTHERAADRDRDSVSPSAVHALPQDFGGKNSAERAGPEYSAQRRNFAQLRSESSRPGGSPRRREHGFSIRGLFRHHAFHRLRDAALRLHDGRSTLFQRADMVEAAWTVVQPILDVWKALPPRDFPNYAAGSWGPDQATELLRREGREWRNPTRKQISRRDPMSRVAD